jgi:uncharacterized protein (TIGR03790 family)
MVRPTRAARAAALTALLVAPAVLAGGGARNVLVVVNERSEESLEIGQHYLRGRDIPESNVCRLDTSTSFSVSKDVYQSEIEQPVLDCIAASPHADRIDYLVLTRGLPIRAHFPDASAPPTKPVSIAELLRVADTSLRGKDQEYGMPYGFQFHPNPYRGRRESHDHSKTFGAYNLRIATMLSSYWSEQAIGLVDLSLASDRNPPHLAADASHYLEETTNPSSPANTRNDGIPAAVSYLQSRGIPAVHVAGSDPDVTGSVVAGHLNAGSYSSISRAEIHSNSYPPGALVCALESFGLVPNNFNPDANPSQTPVTWWIEAGATGGHGTVAEPYNVAFPDAGLFAPYIDGYNLAETYYQGIPYLYWMNLVLGDPLAAPYATPPAVTLISPLPGEVLSGQVRYEATATTPAAAGIRQMEFFVDDELVHVEPDGDGWVRIDTSLHADGAHRLEVVAYEDTLVDTQGRSAVDVVFDNGGLQLSITDPPAGTLVSGVFDVTVDGSPALTEVALSALGATLGTQAGPPPWTVPVDSALLGRGLVALRATATDGGSEVLSASVDLRVVKPPRVHAITPAEGPEAGGTAVTITGWNFEPGAQVFFAGVEALPVTRVDANRLALSTPPGTAGPADLRIDSQGLSATVPGGFTYLAPCPADDDADGVCDDVDNCLDLPNPGQEDADADDCGDDCDPLPDDPAVDCSAPDTDGDGVVDVLDNCPDDPNPAQEDADGNGIGDACEGCAVTASIPDVRVARGAADDVLLTWGALTDPCLASYVVSARSDFADWVAITDRDSDGDAGGDPTFTGAADPGELIWFLVQALGTDGGLGP